MKRPTMPSIVRRTRPAALIHWHARARHDETNVSKRKTWTSDEGYLIVEARPKLRGDRRLYYALRDLQTLIGTATTRQRAERLCEQDIKAADWPMQRPARSTPAARSARRATLNRKSETAAAERAV